MRHLRNHALSIFFGAIFALALLGQSFAGLAAFNDEQRSHSLPPVGFLEFVTSSEFAVDVAENWQSEFLQFFLFILATVWLVQRGSPESKQPGDEGIGSEEEQLLGEHARADGPRWARVAGWRRTLYSNSLLLVMGAVFLASWAAQAVAGRVTYNAEQLEHGQAPVDLLGYLAAPDFWNRTLQNWQSEFLAVGSMAVLSVYLRERGSPESKPVGARHDDTGAEG